MKSLQAHGSSSTTTNNLIIYAYSQRFSGKTLEGILMMLHLLFDVMSYETMNKLFGENISSTENVKVEFLLNQWGSIQAILLFPASARKLFHLATNTVHRTLHSHDMFHDLLSCLPISTPVFSERNFSTPYLAALRSSWLLDYLSVDCDRANIKKFTSRTILQTQSF